jgi:hypothetical protein
MSMIPTLHASGRSTITGAGGFASHLYIPNVGTRSSLGEGPFDNINETLLFDPTYDFSGPPTTVVRMIAILALVWKHSRLVLFLFSPSPLRRLRLQPSPLPPLPLRHLRLRCLRLQPLAPPRRPCIYQIMSQRSSVALFTALQVHETNELSAP